MTIKDELMTVKGRKQSISPSDVVSYAKGNPDSATWHSFNQQGLWDDATAADKMRLEHGRQLIRTFRVNIISAAGQRESVRFFVSPTEERDKPRSYSLRADVLSDRERRLRLRRDCSRDIEGVIRKYADILTALQIETLRNLANEVCVDGGGVGEVIGVAAQAQ